MPRVLILVLNWNNPDDTVCCLESLKRLEYANYQTLVIDNGSWDDSVAVLTRYIYGDPRFKLLTTGENLGFSGGVNHGIDAALQLNADYIWLLNNDAEVAPDCLSALIGAMEAHPDVGIAGSQIFLANSRTALWHAGATLARYIGQPQHLGMGATSGDPHYSTDRLVDYVTGCSFLVRAAVIQQVGKLDDRFYLYYEEVDLCYRSRQQGWQILYVAGSKLWHKVAGSSSGLHERTYYEVRNRLLLILKHRPYELPFVLAYLVIQQILKPLLKGNYEAARFAMLGLADFLRHKFGKLRNKV